MKEEILVKINDLILELKKEGIAAVFMAIDKENFISVKNCTPKAVSQLLVNQIEGSDEMKAAFVQELEIITRKELEENE